MKTQTIHSCFQLRIFITIIADPTNNQPLAMKYNNTLYYYVLNAQGDVVRIVNSSRSVVASYTYDPWGKIISSSGTLADINPLRYRGYYYDAETGFYYLQSRYYDPEIGRFINADSYASTDATGLLSTNMFAYCENDPVNKSDSNGEFLHLAIAAGVGAAVSLASQFTSDLISSVKNGSFELSSWETYFGAIVGGAVGGVVTMCTGTAVGGAVGSGVSTLVGQVLENVTGEENRSAGEIVCNTIIDAAFGSAWGKMDVIKVKGITSGRNSMSAVFSSGLTKLKNQTAKRMSFKVMKKGFISGYVSDSGLTVINGISNRNIIKPYPALSLGTHRTRR